VKNRLFKAVSGGMYCQKTGNIFRCLTGYSRRFERIGHSEDIQMRLENYYSEIDGQIGFSREQASAFAKEVADDFNPIHDPENKMFCVPGDLLFSVALSKLGLSQRMLCSFTGMVSDGTLLHFHDSGSQSLSINDQQGKTYLTIERSGDVSDDQNLIWDLARNYVRFSGHNFPDTLVPLMAEQGIMLNPARPLVIYENMELDLLRLDIEKPELKLTESSCEVKGKKGSVCLHFSLISYGDVVGYGTKYISLRGLRPYDQQAVDQLVAGYRAHKAQYLG
jgi:hypothetical protein